MGKRKWLGKELRKQKVVDFLKSGPKTTREISTELILTESTIRDYLKELEEADIVRRVKVRGGGRLVKWKLNKS